MHDWNSAKAIFRKSTFSSSKGEKILPQKISYWKIIPEKQSEDIKSI